MAEKYNRDWKRLEISPPCGLFGEIWVDLIVDVGLREWTLLTRARLRRVCKWFARVLLPVRPPFDGQAYSDEMAAWRRHGLDPPPRLGFNPHVYPWWHTRCPTCGGFYTKRRETSLAVVLTCDQMHIWTETQFYARHDQPVLY